MNGTLAAKIVDAILDDLRDRAGIGDELDSIDDDIAQEMREELISLVVGLEPDRA